ncbi:MAG: CotH kinase family protein [Bacteroidales bacterium]|nr:CotH kinase family protein [Bacteroidales bacterium]
MRIFLCIGFLWLLSFGLYSQQHVVFSPLGGIFEEACEVTLSFPDETCSIHYTLNGNTPTIESSTYQGPLTLSESLYSTSDIYTLNIHSPLEEDYCPEKVRHAIVIRAAAFDTSGNCVSSVTTQSYFVKSLDCDVHGLPVLSLCADSSALFDYETGIMVPGIFFNPDNPKYSGNYYQKGREWERLCNVECYANDTCYFNQRAGLRTHGDSSRRFSQKGLKIYARKEYGKKRLDFPLFETTNLTSFKHLVLKPFGASWYESGVEDYLCDQMATRLNVESGANLPVILFLNGEYWGIYLLKEKIDEDFLNDHFDVEEDNCTIINNWWGTADCGDNSNFKSMMSWLSETDLSDSTEYARLCELVDIHSFMDYVIFETFAKNMDWPSNNMRCWQENDGPWRWIFYDGDACFHGYAFQTFDNLTYTGDALWPSSKTSTLLFRKLIENQIFINSLLTRYHELMSSDLAYTNTYPYLQDIIPRIEGEIPCQSERFGKPKSIEAWNKDLKKIQEFLETRPSEAYEELRELLFSRCPQVSQLSFYPNPSSGSGVLSFQSDFSGLMTVSVFNSFGQKVVSETVAVQNNDNTIPLHLDLPAGVYVIQIGNGWEKIIIYNN